SDQPEYGKFFCKQKSGEYPYALQYSSSQTIRATVNASGRFDTPSIPNFAGEWAHLGFTYDGAALILYKDGEEVSRIEATGELQQNDLSLSIGGRLSSGQNYVGIIDDVRFYSHALTAEEVKATMSGERFQFPYAKGPDPADGALNADTWVNLSWSAGDSAVSHDVYLSDSFDDVNDSAADAFQGNQLTTDFLVGFPGFPYPEGMVPGATYYWRIDEVNEADPNSPWRGEIWSFSIPPKTAYFPDPIDGAEFVDLDATLSWTPGFGAKLHTVYLGDSFEDVNNATGGVSRGTVTYKPASPLESEKVYYWRVDEFDIVETHKGDIWAFTTPGAVGNSQPANGAVDVPMVATLSWTPADTAASSDLYFGADADAVKNADTASPEYAGNKALGSESHDPGKLALGESYHWRVDAVYPDRTVKGLLWSFVAAGFIMVDDFEAYNDIDPPDPNSNRIFDKWIDGFGTTTNGALVGNDLPPYAEQTVVHSGAQSMIYRYDNAGKTSEATLALVYPRDWTEEGVTKLSLWFRGASANAADRMFVALGNTVVYHADSSATQITGWNEWVIDLTAFAGVDLANVGEITIGFGTRNSPAAGGAGTMYFDDIRLIK
ncbi:MAG: LamG domain-containing protein, partial [Planctomycetota bacterium]